MIGQIEKAVINHVKGVELHSVRTSLPWECDVLAVTKSGYASEFEIKTSKSDYKADFKKPKHRQFEKGNGGLISKFWFVTPKGLVNDVPSYAGLMYYQDGVVEVIKHAPRLKAEKVGPKNMRRLWRSMMFRFLTLNFDKYLQMNYICREKDVKCDENGHQVQIGSKSHVFCCEQGFKQTLEDLSNKINDGI